MYNVTLNYLTKLEDKELLYSNGKGANLIHLDEAKELLEEFEVALLKYYEEKKVKENKHY